MSQEGLVKGPQCPICGSALIYHRVDDGEMKVQIDSPDSITELANVSDGSTNVYCSQDESHKIPMELWEEVCDIANGFGY